MNSRDIKRFKKESCIITALLVLESHLDGYNMRISCNGSSFGNKDRYIYFAIREAMNQTCVDYKLHHSGKTTQWVVNKLKRICKDIHKRAPFYFTPKGYDNYMNYLVQLNYLLEKEQNNG